MAIHLRATHPEPELLRLPWQVPLAQWPADLDVPLAKGISRHVVRFVTLGHRVVAVKETREQWAHHEYAMLRNLQRIGLPTVVPMAVVTGRTGPGGEPIEPALVTRVLQRSLPYRAVFSYRLTDDTLDKVIDALVVLLVRLHNEGFFWGDCSLSNVLFRRTGDRLEAYLVDAETGELHESLSDGQREHDLDLLRTNVFGELLDLQAGGAPALDGEPIDVPDRVLERYATLWDELHGVEEFDLDEMWRLQQRARRLNALGFDVDEFDIVTDLDGDRVRIQPKVVESGHHCRRLRALTGLDVPDAQAQVLLGELDAYAAANGLSGQDPMVIAHRWMTEIYQPLDAMIPPEYRDDVDTPQALHDLLVHRWFLSESAGHEVDFFETARSWVDEVLPRTAATLRAASASEGDPV